MNIQKPMANIDPADEALRAAAEAGNASEIRALLARAPRSARASDAEGTTALMIAAMQGNEECFDLLLAQSDPKACDADGWQALSWAACCGHAGLVAKLIPLSDPRAISRRLGQSPLALAAAALDGGHPECLELLMGFNDPRARDHGGATALHWAASRGNETCASILLEHVDPLVADEEGTTALINAAHQGSAGCCQLLIGRSNADALDHAGFRALDYAATQGHLDCVASLMQASKNPADAWASAAGKATAAQSAAAAAMLQAGLLALSEREELSQSAQTLYSKPKVRV